MTDTISTDAGHPSIKALRKLRKALGFSGVVLISFTNARIGANSSAVTDEFGDVMIGLADMILADIASGRYDAVLKKKETDGK